MRYDGIMSYGLGNIDSIALDLLPRRETLTIRVPLAEADSLQRRGWPAYASGVTSGKGEAL